MRAVVFLGPTLPLDIAKARLSATYLPPVAQGDVWRAVTSFRPSVIGLIDGVFRHTPAVWHKEILFALQEGVHVLGAASMGALRAAELEPFGVRGVGVIFEAYRDNRLAPTGDAPFEDDDEVALLHGPAEAGWQPLSEAMVDIRCSVAAAQRAGVIDQAERDLITAAAKATFFTERSWPMVLDRAVACGLERRRQAVLSRWLEHGRVAQKRTDALELLDTIGRFLAERPKPFRPAFSFASTSVWAAAIAEAGQTCLDETRSDTNGPLAVLDELRLDPETWRATRRAALLYDLAARTTAPNRGSVRAVLADLRERLGLADRQAVDAWLEATGAEPGFLDRVAEAESALRELEHERAPYLLTRMLDHLRVDGRYGSLRQRAEAKAAYYLRIAALETQVETPEDLRILSWYFEERLGIGIPDDLTAYAHDLGFADAESLRRILWREFHFVTGSQAFGATP